MKKCAIAFSGACCALLVTSGASGAGCWQTFSLGFACDTVLPNLPPNCLVIESLDDPNRVAQGVNPGGRSGRADYLATCEGNYYTENEMEFCIVPHPFGPVIYEASFATGPMCPPQPGG